MRVHTGAYLVVPEGQRHQQEELYRSLESVANGHRGPRNFVIHSEKHEKSLISRYLDVQLLSVDETI
jgi:hypothetical protein